MNRQATGVLVGRGGAGALENEVYKHTLLFIRVREGRAVFKVREWVRDFGGRGLRGDPARHLGRGRGKEGRVRGGGVGHVRERGPVWTRGLGRAGESDWSPGCNVFIT